jgi:hypothetical protein
MERDVSYGFPMYAANVPQPNTRHRITMANFSKNVSCFDVEVSEEEEDGGSVVKGVFVKSSEL